jgi:hypothetical protein
MGKKNPSTWAGVLSLLAVIQRGPAQGGKAGDALTSKQTVAEISEKYTKKYFYENIGSFA